MSDYTVPAGSGVPRSRRSFLRLAGASGALGLLSEMGASTASAVEPIQRKGKSSLRLSLAAYSFREAFKAGKMDMPKFIDYCFAQGLEGTELTSYYFPEDANDAYFIGLKRHAFLKGIAISGTAVGNNFALPHGAELDRQIGGREKDGSTARLCSERRTSVCLPVLPKASIERKR